MARIKDLPKIERPREKLILYGSEKLSTSELLAILLLTGGTCGVIVNEGVLFGRNRAAVQIRKYILYKTELQAVVSLPQGVFNPYAGVKTSFLIFKNTGKPTDKVWFYEVENDGYSKGSQRKPQPDKNDLPKLLELWSTQKVEKHFFWLTPVKDITANDYILSANTYNPYSSEEEINYREPKEILKEIEAEEEKLKSALDEVKRIL